MFLKRSIFFLNISHKTNKQIMDIINKIIAHALYLQQKNVVMVVFMNLLFCCLGNQNHIGKVLNGGMKYINTAFEHQGIFFCMIDFYLRGNHWNTPLPPCPPGKPCIRRNFDTISNSVEWNDKVQHLFFFLSQCLRKQE